MKLYYKQIDLVNREREKYFILYLKNKNYYIIGVEIFDDEISLLCDINYDPQHRSSNYKKTALEMVFNNKDFLLKINAENILLITIKTDIDSISTMALITMVFKKIFELNGDLILRLKALSFSDKHGYEDNWEDKESNFNIPYYNKYGIPVSLIIFISDIRVNITYKVETMINFLLTGEFKENKKYLKIDKRKKNNSKKNTFYEIIIPNKIVYVNSSYRGAIGYGYNIAPVVIAENNKYIFGNISNKLIGRKYTIAQYNEKYINLSKLKIILNNLEYGWGGSPVIIGSPQDKPSLLSKKIIIKEILDL